MSNLAVGQHDLLQYDSRYGVLICRECRYAIQKSALQSHLLRHKIYRGDRQRLLSAIAQLEVLEPDQVPLPDPVSPPIDALPVISGYCCTVARCGNLCASFKRMKRHWSEVHGLSDPPPSTTISRPVKLQTFFKGTKLKYFEVASSLESGTIAAEQPPIVNEDELYDEGGYGASSSMPPLGHLQPPEHHLKSPSIGVDLETLTYFHHFTTSTSLTLPSSDPSHPTLQYWQTVVVLQALQQRWLMCGLLAISACHLATVAEDPSISRPHLEKSEQFYSEFCAGWDGISNHSSAADESTKKAGNQIRCILQCAYGAVSARVGQSTTPDVGDKSQLQSIMTTVWALYPSAGRNDNDDLQAESYAQAKRILESGTGDNIPSVLLNSLRELPSRMAWAFGKPDNVQDVLSTLSAIASLAECCDASFASDEVEVAWQSMAKWLLAKVPDHFHNMVSCHSPAALVVVAHWAAFLVRRVEDCGCWFLKGSTTTILLQIAELLPVDDHVQSLVQGLMP